MKDFRLPKKTSHTLSGVSHQNFLSSSFYSAFHSHLFYDDGDGAYGSSAHSLPPPAVVAVAAVVVVVVVGGKRVLTMQGSLPPGLVVAAAAAVGGTPAYEH